MRVVKHFVIGQYTYRQRQLRHALTLMWGSETEVHSRISGRYRVYKRLVFIPNFPQVSDKCRIYVHSLNCCVEIHTDDPQIISSAYGVNPDSRMLYNILHVVNKSDMLL